jgi:hypothetical protein
MLTSTHPSHQRLVADSFRNLDLVPSNAQAVFKTCYDAPIRSSRLGHWLRACPTVNEEEVVTQDFIVSAQTWNLDNLLVSLSKERRVSNDNYPTGAGCKEGKSGSR